MADQNVQIALNLRSHMLSSLVTPRSGPFSAPMRTPRPVRTPPVHTPRMYLPPPPPVLVSKPSPDPVSAENMKLMVRRLRRPTYLSRVKSLPSRQDWYFENHSIVWSKLPLYSDHKLTMWTPMGHVRRSCRL